MKKNPLEGLILVWNSPFGALLVAAVIGLTIHVITWNAGIDWKIGFVLALCTSSLSLLLRLVWLQQAANRPPKYEIYRDQARALRKAGEIVQGGDVVWGMWTAMSYTAELKEYYRQTMRRGLMRTMRIIDLEIDTVAIRDHLKENWSALRDGSYTVYFIRRLDFELLLVDDERAGVFLSAGPGHGFLVLTGKGELARCVRGMIDVLRDAGVRFPSDKFPSEFDEEKVVEWLRTESEAPTVTT